MNTKKIILDLCGGTGSWSRPYRDAGYDVRNITLPKYDIRIYEPPKSVYGILFAPPCILWTTSANRWWKKRTQNEVFEQTQILCAGLKIIIHTKPKFWVIENPVGRMSRILGKAKLIFNPCDYGDAYYKRTCLWGEFNIPQKNSVSVPDVPYSQTPIGRLGGKSERTKMLRGITPQGFAKAFMEANQ